MRRVVITGVGVISPVGTGKQKFWNALINGKNGIKRCKKLDTTKYRTHMAGEVDDFESKRYVDVQRLKYPTVTATYAVAAVKMAIDDSGFQISENNRVGVVLGANTIDPLTNAEAILYWHKSKNRYASTPPQIYENMHANMHAIRVAEYFGLKYCATTIPAACAAGNTAISYAFDLVKSGSAKAMFAGGHDPMNHLAYGGFDKMKAMSPDYCRPFDKNRRGLIIGEGAGIILMEDMEYALKRRAKIYGEILGVGLSTDSYNAAIPHPEGIGAIQAIRMALKMARIGAGDVDYINAHGTATIQNDRMESRAIRAVFGRKVFVSSIKSMTGHCMGASSGIEACASALIVERDIIPANINYTAFDPDCDINIVANMAVKKKVNILVSNSFAFGGNSAVIVIAKFRGR